MAIEPTQDDIGREVIGPYDRIGVLTHVSEKWVYVLYPGERHALPIKPEKLRWKSND